MSACASRFCGLCLGLIAFAWPWDAYQALPFLFWPVSAILLAILTFFAALDATKRRALSVPFELAWPLGLVGVLTGIHAAITAALEYVVPVAAAIAVSWAAYAMLDARETARRCFRLSILSCAAVAGLSLLAQYRPLYGLLLYQVFPTAFDARTGAVLAFSPSVGSGALTLALGAVLAFADLAAPHRVWFRRLFSLVMLCIIAAPLVVLVQAQARALDTWMPPGYWQWHPLLAVAVTVAVWLGVRTGAKSLLAGYDERNRYVLILAGLPLLAVLFCTFIPVAPDHGHIFLLAMAARFASLPPEETEVRSAFRWPLALACIALLSLLLWNVFHVDPLNTRDPRNYDEIARRGFDEPDSRPLLRTLHFINERSPSERRSWLWIARLHLRAGALDTAARDFQRATEPYSGPAAILPPPPHSDIEQFLEEVRDHCSPLTPAERGLAYERALVIAGQPKNALSILRLRSDNAQEVPYASNLFANVLAELLWDNRLAPELRNWTSGELLAIFESIGAQVVRAPDGFPQTYLPAVLMGHRPGESFLLRAWTPRAIVGFEVYAHAKLESVAISPHWGEAAPGAGGAWGVPLFDDENSALLQLKFGSTLEWTVPEPTALESCPATPRPALLVLLPRSWFPCSVTDPL